LFRYPVLMLDKSRVLQDTSSFLKRDSDYYLSSKSITLFKGTASHFSAIIPTIKPKLKTVLLVQYKSTLRQIPNDTVHLFNNLVLMSDKSHLQTDINSYVKQVPTKILGGNWLRYSSHPPLTSHQSSWS